MNWTRRPWPLRLRLLAALLGLCAAGLAAFAVAGVLMLEQSLLARVDSQLVGFASTFTQRPPSTVPPPPPGTVQLPTEFQVGVFTASGSLIRVIPSDSVERPEIPAEVLSSVPGRPITVSGEAGGQDWRSLIMERPGGERVAVSMSLETNQGTVHQLLLIEVAAGALVLALLGAVAWAVVRLGLHPLTRMERTAEAIAAGDIDRRVTDADPRTEIGRLGQTLNTMLERLATALREREQSERRLRHFVADASHELRTPLTSIRGFAELYHRGRTARDPAAERLLSRIEGEAERMGVLVEDMLLLARLDQEPALEPTTVDLHVLASDVVQAAQARDRQRPIQLTISDEPVFVNGDEHRIHQAIANLVGNAMAHTPPGTSVRVTVARQEDSALVEVHDNGQGIDPEHLPHVFDRFYRADPSRSRAQGGTGLGLAIAAALVEAHGGRIGVESVPCEGTTFRIWLPLDPSQDA